MDGIQQTVYDGLIALAEEVKTGAFGVDDDAFSDDDALGMFIDNLQDEVLSKID